MIFTGRRNPIPVVGIALHVRRPTDAAVQAEELIQIDQERIEVSVFDKLEDEPIDLIQPHQQKEPLSWKQDSKAIDFPRLDTYLRATPAEIPFSDRAAVACIKALIAGQKQIQLLQLSCMSRYLCRIPRIFHLWVRIKVSSNFEGAWIIGREGWADEPWIRAASALRGACHSLAEKNGESMILTAQLVKQLPDWRADLAIYQSLLDNSVASAIAETWNELVADGSASQFVEDIVPAAREESRTAGPFGLSPERYQAVFLRANMPPFDTAAEY